MTKPFPCCSCNCAVCPEYSGEDDWIARFCNLSNGSEALTSSTTGNTLSVDINALPDIAFQPVVTSAGPPVQFAKTVSILVGKSWVYGGLTVSNLEMRFTGNDNCGKRRVQDAAIYATVASFIGTTVQNIWAANEPSYPGSPNCEQILEAPIATRTTTLFGNTGSFMAQLDIGFALTCPAPL